jgi:hypothetical protein
MVFAKFDKLVDMIVDRFEPALVVEVVAAVVLNNSFGCKIPQKD